MATIRVLTERIALVLANNLEKAPRLDPARLPMANGVRIMNGWCALLVRFGNAVLVLISPAIRIRPFWCEMLSRERSPQ